MNQKTTIHTTYIQKVPNLNLSWETDDSEVSHDIPQYSR